MRTPRRAGVVGVGWQGSAALAAQAAQAVSALVVASRVAPGEYALWGFAAVLFNAQFLLTSLGFAPALVHERDDGLWRRAYDAAFTVTVAGAALAGLALALAAGPVVDALAPDLAGDGGRAVVRTMAVVLAALAVLQIPLAALDRRLEFRRKALVELAGTAVYVIVVAAMLVGGAGVWSLLGAKVGQVVTLLAGATGVAAPRPALRRTVEWRLLRRLVRFGGVIGASAIVGVVFTNLDTVVVARRFGSGPLGSYALAFSIATIVPTLLAVTVGRVFFAVISTVRADAGQLRVVVDDLVHLCALVVLPVAGLQALFAEDLVVAVFGSDWTEAGALLVPMAAYAAGRVAALVVNTVASGMTRPGVVLRVELVALACAAAGVALWGDSPTSVAVAFAAGQWIGALVGFVSVRDALRPAWPTAVRVTGLAGVAVAAAVLVDLVAGAAVAAAAGVVVYAVDVVLLDRRARDLLRGWRSRG